MFKNGQPEELFALLKKFKKTIDVTRTATVSGRINYIWVVVCREFLRDFEYIVSQSSGTTNAYLKDIQEGLIAYFPPLDAVAKKNCAINRAMQKPCTVSFKILPERLTYLNNYLPDFHGLENSKKMDKSKFNKIIPNANSNVWSNQSYLQG